MLRKSYKKALTFAAVIGLLVFLHFSGIARPFENAVTRALNPVFRGFYGAGAGLRGLYDDQTAGVDWRARTKELEERVISLTEENAGLKMAEEENRLLREHLLFLKKNEYRYVMAGVIARGDASGIFGRDQTIIIDKGRRDGLYEGLGVVSHKGVIIGKIAEVNDTASLVLLVNDSRCKLAAAALNGDKTAGITEGELGLTVRMGFIPRDMIIEEGDIVVTSGLEESIPRGLVIGRVVNVSGGSNELWQTATIEPMINPENLLMAAVLLP